MSEITAPAVTPAPSAPKLPNRHAVLVLQHPQEKREALSTAPLLEESLDKVTRRIGLSWPNFKKALGSEASAPANWLVLYLGTQKQLPISKDLRAEARKEARSMICLFDKKGANARIATPLDLERIEGVVVLDGTWKQAKTMWWRNPWLLKLQRAMVVSPERSMYGNVRKEPRPECVSTLEAVAWTLDALGEPAEIRDGLKARFAEFLKEHGGRRPAPEHRERGRTRAPEPKPEAAEAEKDGE